jgi:hypothetical protein
MDPDVDAEFALDPDTMGEEDFDETIVGDIVFDREELWLKLFVELADGQDEIVGVGIIE